MDRLHRLGLFKYIQLGRVLVVGDTVYVSPTIEGNLRLHELGNLKDFARSYARQAARLPALRGEPPILGQARSICAKLPSIRFCLTSLLRTLMGQGSFDKKYPAHVLAERDRLLGRLSDLSNELGQTASEEHLETALQEEFRKQFSPPLVIDGDAVVPLAEVCDTSNQKDCVQVEDQLYRLCHERSRPLDKSIEAIRSRANADNRYSQQQLRREERMAKAIVETNAELLATFPGTIHDSYCIIHSDETHQLQHNHRGDFVLVRGPVQHRLERGTLCIGLPIQGKCRTEMLRREPGVAGDRNSFWTENSHRKIRPICMGNSRQYQHLRTQPFTDAEAIIQWVDAAVIVATSRPEYHSIHRGEQVDLSLARQMRLWCRERRHAE